MPADPENEASVAGVSLALARSRVSVLSSVRYHLFLNVPSDPEMPVEGSVRVRFQLASVRAVIFDFVAAPSMLRATRAGGRPIHTNVTPEHICVDADWLHEGENEVVFEFVTDASPLNRQPDFIYSLFVPARARFVFPCFDQPDLKARFTLELTVPAGWQAVSNAQVDSEFKRDGLRTIRFRETEPLPTYLFAFAAGVLEMLEGSRAGRIFRVWHRERDTRLLTQNIETVFDLHGRAVSWLESYTGIGYPFSQFDMVLVPSFQFSGMEHPGAILYNAGRLLLESSASEHDHLTRAALIAHETAHIWFGDFVTMRWFDDVWLKEVFANFVAEKILAEMPEAKDHHLRFFLANYPAAYAVDRSAGANAIRQPLDNLAGAGQLYGPIIYLKAPIVFRQLEMMLGEGAFRDGVRRYLEAFGFANADWHDLLSHLAPGADTELRRWSDVWVDEAGRPRVTVEARLDDHNSLEGVLCRVDDATGRERVWPQTIHVALGHDDRVEHLAIDLRARETWAALAGERPRFILGGGRGLGYGYFPLDAASRAWLLDHVADIGDALTRGVAWAALWDELLEAGVAAADWLDAALRAIAKEEEEQNVERLLTMIAKAFWLFLSATERDVMASRMEGVLRERLGRAASTTARASWFTALRQLTTTPDGCVWLERIWRRDEPVPGLSLGESDETALAFELALRGLSSMEEVLERQAARIEDPERRSRFNFVTPALSPDPRERESAFARLADRSTRTREPWVLALLHYLNHPLRQAHARRFIAPGLALLPEILRTGDIFFPARWAEALLSGHASPAAALAVREFLDTRTDFPPSLQRTVLVASDLLFRVGLSSNAGRS